MLFTDYPFFTLTFYTQANMYVLSRNSIYLNGIPASGYATATHTHSQYLKKAAKYTFMSDAIQGLQVKDLAAAVHTHTEYVPKDTTFLYASTLIENGISYSPQDFSDVNHTHDTYWLRTDIVPDVKNLVSDSGTLIHSSMLAPAVHTHPEYLLAWQEVPQPWATKVTDILQPGHIATDADWLVIDDQYYNAQSFAGVHHDHGDVYAQHKVINAYRLVSAPDPQTNSLGVVGSTKKLNIIKAMVGLPHDVAVKSKDTKYLQSYVGADYPASYVPEVVADTAIGSHSVYSKGYTAIMQEGYALIGRTVPICTVPSNQLPIVFPMNTSAEAASYAKVSYGIQYVTHPGGITLYIVGFPGEDLAQQVLRFKVLILFPR